jgi:CRP/FNR family transcriptional regulator
MRSASSGGSKLRASAVKVQSFVLRRLTNYQKLRSGQAIPHPENVMLGLDTSSLPVRSLRRGASLFHAGDLAEHIFQVIEGRIRLERVTPDGRMIAIHTAQAGTFFAEASLFASTYHCGAVALKASEVRLYPKKLVLESVQQDPIAARGLLALVSRQLQTARFHAELHGIRSAQERVMTFLAAQANAEGCVVIPHDLQDLALTLRLSREAFYRTLGMLEADGQIRRHTGIIEILTPA